MTMTYGINDLASVVLLLPEKDRAFAESIILGARKWGGVTPKQSYWVDILTKRAKGEDKPARPSISVGDLSRINYLFKQAASHLKRPKIVLGAGLSETIKLSVAGPTARVPGSINVVSMRDGTWYGRIVSDGTFQQSQKASVGAGPEVITVLREFAENPARVASKHGRLTGCCAFCNTPLKDERSTSVGYGPVCAKHYGLEWGEVKPLIDER